MIQRGRFSRARVIRRSVPCAVAVSCLVALAALPGGAGSHASPKPAVNGAPSPPAKPVDPTDKLLATGWDQLGLVNYGAALKTFRQVMAAEGSREQKAAATFALGHLWQYRRPGADVEKARRRYEQVVSGYKGTPSARLGLMALARLADTPELERDRDVKRAQTLYKKIIHEGPADFIADEAVLRLAMTYLEKRGERKAEDVGAKLLREHLSQRPDNFLAHAMHLTLGSLLQNRGQYRQAVEQLIAADRADERAAMKELTPEQSSAPPAKLAGHLTQVRVMARGARASLYFRIAKIAEKHLKDYALAARWYERIVREIRRDNRFYVSKVAAERCRKLAAKGSRP